VDQVVRHRPLTTEIEFDPGLYHVRLTEYKWNLVRFSQSNSDFSCQYHSTITLQLFFNFMLLLHQKNKSAKPWNPQIKCPSGNRKHCKEIAFNFLDLKDNNSVTALFWDQSQSLIRIELWSSGPQPLTAIIDVPYLILSTARALLLIDVSDITLFLRNYIKFNLSILKDTNVGSDEQGNKVSLFKKRWRIFL
jgi:hypothetical protein